MRITGYGGYYNSPGYKIKQPGLDEKRPGQKKPDAQSDADNYDVRTKACENREMLDRKDKTSDRHFEISQAQAKDEQNKIKILITCLKISRRIVSGDNVPYKDHEFLMDHDPALYFKSISMRIPKDNPYDYKRLSEDEKNDIQLDSIKIDRSGLGNNVPVIDSSAYEASIDIII